MASIQTRLKKGGTYSKKKKYRPEELQHNIQYRAEWVPDKGKYRQCSITCRSRQEANELLPEVQIAENEHRRFMRPGSRKMMLSSSISPVPSDGIGSWAAEIRPRDKSKWTISDLVHDYAVDHIITNSWTGSTPGTSYGIIRNYIDPYIGGRLANSMDTKAFKDYLYALLQYKAVPGNRTGDPGYISVNTLREIKKILSPAYDYGINEYRMFDYNPVKGVKLPQKDKNDSVRTQLTEEQLKQLLDACDDHELKTFISVMVSGTTRTGEAKALQWKFLGISDEDIADGKPYITITHNLARIKKYVVERWAKKKERPIHIFPDIKENTESCTVLKVPKTPASCRKVYIPKTVALALREHKSIQDKTKEELGDLYQDYDLVFCQKNGRPLGDSNMPNRFKKLLKKAELPECDLYSLRHTGATAKLRATKDIKAVQGDMGHTTPDMLMKTYAAMNEADRIAMPTNLESRIFSKINF